MTPAQLSRTVLLSLRGVVGDVGLRGVELPERVVVESPPRRGGGDYGTGVVLQLARHLRPGSAPGGATATPPGPLDLARRLGARLESLPGVARTDVAGAGFVNVTLNASGRAALVRELARPAHPSSPADAPARDAARWAAATADGPRASVGALLVRTADSPLFRVQYAHSRARAVLRGADALGVRPEAGADGHAYAAPAERALLALLADHDRLAAAARTPAAPRTSPTLRKVPASAPRADAAPRLARHLVAVADAFLDLRDTCPPLPQGDQKPGAAHRARTALAEAAGSVLAGGLAQLGVTAPAHL
ncbi:DALR anticodon-binding domain-containing protein [Streptomyces sp. NPDC054784]